MTQRSTDSWLGPAVFGSDTSAWFYARVALGRAAIALG